MKKWSVVRGPWSVVAACGLALLITFGFSTPVPAADDKGPGTEDAQEFIFLSEARPVLVRLHVQVDGKPLQVVWDDFIKHVFRYMDVSCDGSLNQEEIARMPSASQLLGGGGDRRQGRGRAPAQPTLADLDTDKDGKVSPVELGAYYRKNGLAPFQVQLSSPQSNPIRGAAAYFSGRQPDPPVEAIGKESFALLDTNKDGKLTGEELTAASARLLAMDEDEDEIVTPAEIAPDAIPKLNPFAIGRMMGNRDGADSAGSKLLVPLASPGEVPVDLVRRMQDRYGARAEKGKEKKLSRKDVGLDQTTFAALDLDRDGLLDDKELAGFVKRQPDLEMVVRLGKKANGEARIEVMKAKESPLAGKLRLEKDLAMLDLGATQLELRGIEANRTDRFGGFIRQQTLAQLKQADADGDGFIDAKEAENNRAIRGIFKQLDRNNDGKVSTKELDDYVEQSRELQARASASCVTLALSNESRGLFTLFDDNGDGRLSVRELRQGPKLLQQYDRDGKAHLAKGDIPHKYQLALSQGPAGSIDTAAILNLYYDSGESDSYESPAGPRWFRKMDRNRDGDVSRKEFLFSTEEFRRLDADGDGLISLEEAKKAGKQK